MWASGGVSGVKPPRYVACCSGGAAPTCTEALFRQVGEAMSRCPAEWAVCRYV